jgi:predicted NUDIX family phosphoesterase
MEFVFVAPREALFPAFYPQGLHVFPGEGEAQEFLARLRTHGFFVERARAERTPSWKQVIPYCVVSNGAEVLLTRRRAKGGEARLHDKLSIGIGGHINPVDHDDDADGEDLLLAAARREIEEELEVRGTFELRLVGFLNDDSNAVGAVHVGLVFVANPSGPVRIREEDVLEGHMVALEELRAKHGRGENFETWSSLLIAHLDRFLHVEQHATT